MQQDDVRELISVRVDIADGGRWYVLEGCGSRSNGDGDGDGCGSKDRDCGFFFSLLTYLPFRLPPSCSAETKCSPSVN